MTESKDPVATETYRPVDFPFQRPGRIVRSFFRAGARVYRGPMARFMGAYSMLLLKTTGRRTGLRAGPR